MKMAHTHGEKLLTDYFWTGMPYKTILLRLKVFHGLNRSMTWLKMKYRQLGLKRRGYNDPNLSALKDYLLTLIDTPYGLRGYRSIHRLLRRKFHVSVRRDTIMQLMRIFDPVGVAQRRKRRLKRRMYYSKGPNFIWHIDGYDKLKPYGLCLHACIDGFSRKVIWFTVASSNSDPQLIVRYYLEAVEQIKGCPKIVRADLGTENCLTVKAQIAFRFYHSDANSRERSFVYGPSTANIRIEAFWSQWRRSVCDWWIAMCKSLVNEGYFNYDNILHRYSLYLVFSHLLWHDMNDFVEDWNSHLIRKNKLSQSPSGCPCDLYDLPELQGVTDHKMPVDPYLWAHFMLKESKTAPPLCPADFEENALFFLERYLGFTINDVTHSNCKQIYIALTDFLSNLL